MRCDLFTLDDGESAVVVPKGASEISCRRNSFLLSRKAFLRIFILMRGTWNQSLIQSSISQKLEKRKKERKKERN